MECLTLWWASQWFTAKATLARYVLVPFPIPISISIPIPIPIPGPTAKANPDPLLTVTLIVCFWSTTKRCLCLTFSFNRFPPFSGACPLLARPFIFVCFGLVRFSSSDSLRLLRLLPRIIYCSGCRVVCQKFLCGNLSMNEARMGAGCLDALTSSEAKKIRIIFEFLCSFIRATLA